MIPPRLTFLFHLLLAQTFLSFPLQAQKLEKPAGYIEDLLPEPEFEEFYAEELPQILELAASGDARAQYRLGRSYEEGWAAQKNLQQAFLWIEQAAAQGYAPAQTSLAAMYYDGRGVEFDLEKAAAWALKAVEKGDAIGQYQLGILHYWGIGLEENEESASNLFVRSAEQGYAPAQARAGEVYRRARGDFALDPKKSLGWYQQAAKQGDAFALFNLGRFYRFGDNKLSVKRNLKSSWGYYQKAAELGSVYAQEDLGRMYLQYGQNTLEIKRGIQWLNSAAIQGNQDAQIKLGRCYFEGTQVLKNDEMALYWFELAALNKARDSNYTSTALY